MQVTISIEIENTKIKRSTTQDINFSQPLRKILSDLEAFYEHAALTHSDYIVRCHERNSK